MAVAEAPGGTAVTGAGRVGLLGPLVRLLGAAAGGRRDGADAALPAQLVPRTRGPRPGGARARLHGPRGVSRSHRAVPLHGPREEHAPCRPQL